MRRMVGVDDPTVAVPPEHAVGVDNSSIDRNEGVGNVGAVLLQGLRMHLEPDDPTDRFTHREAFRFITHAHTLPGVSDLRPVNPWARPPGPFLLCSS